jgi:hypothetical protein
VSPGGDPGVTMTRRLVMWSGPRNISTAMMRAFENRADCAVSDEPFYACYLARTGIDHPMRAEILASMERDYAAVAEALRGPSPNAAEVWYQKHMTHHMLPGDSLDWARGAANCFLIRDPRRVVASYARKRENPTPADIGLAREAELYREIEAMTGAPPPVLDADDVLADPEHALRALCAAVDLPFDSAMLAWPAGRRDSDGVWAAHWYGAVERSTGFHAPQTAAAEPALSEAERAVADSAMADYRFLWERRLLA